MAGLWGAGDYTFCWDFCILAVIGRWLLCSGGCLLRFHCTIFVLRPFLTTMHAASMVFHDLSYFTLYSIQPHVT